MVSLSFDNNLNSDPIFSDSRFQKTTFITLEHSTAANTTPNLNYINLHIYESTITNTQSADINIFYRGKRNENNNRVFLKRLFLCCVQSIQHLQENHCLVYIVEIIDLNKDLWGSAINPCDIRKAYIACFIKLPSSKPVHKYMQDNVLQLILLYELIAFDFHISQPMASMNKEIKSNSSLALIYIALNLEIDHTDVRNFSWTNDCSGKQLVSDWYGS